MKEMFDSDRVKTILQETLSSVLGEMTFLDCVPSTHQDPGALRTLAHCVGIDALKPGSFRIEIKVSEELRKKIVSMLFDADTEGAPPQDSSEADLLLEILNVVAGNFITSYFGQDSAPKLELPRYLYFADPAEGEIVAESVMDAEGSPIHIALRSVRYRY